MIGLKHWRLGCLIIESTLNYELLLKSMLPIGK